MHIDGLRQKIAQAKLRETIGVLGGRFVAPFQRQIKAQCELIRLSEKDEIAAQSHRFSVPGIEKPARLRGIGQRLELKSHIEAVERFGKILTVVDRFLASQGGGTAKSANQDIRKTQPADNQRAIFYHG